MLQQQNKELEKHSEFKNKIFSLVSHDLRAPFNSIKGILNLEKTRTMSEADVKHIFGLLGKETDVTMNMLQNLLVWSRAQMEVNHVNLQPVNLRLLVDENVQVAASHAALKNITLTNTVAEDVFALADKERLNFVLRNLLMNAVKFTYEGGEIKLQMRVQGSSLSLMVSDNGQGIAPRYISKLFSDERFTTRGTLNEKGTGLGLMLCKEFVESIQGTIEVESEEGRGSTFYVTLQKADEPVAAPNETTQLLPII
jgi:signal transduction histidine kinase